MRRSHAIVILTLLISACGGAGSPFTDDIVTDSPPIVSRVEPTSGPPGTAITIYGFGYSISAPVNIISMAGTSMSASEYQLLPNPSSTEIEALTATIPNNAVAGDTSVLVIVYDNVSNADVLFTVTP